MNIKKIIFITVILLLLPFTLKLWSGDSEKAASPFTGIKASMVGFIPFFNVSDENKIPLND